jgi:hypothetical protein
VAETQKKDPYAGLSGDQISELLQRNEAAILALPGFRPPESREEAVALLAKAGIDPDEAPQTTEQLAGESRYEISTPAGGFTGDRFGVRFHNGKGYTDDRDAARACADCGYSVVDRSRAPAPPAPPKK